MSEAHGRVVGRVADRVAGDGGAWTRRIQVGELVPDLIRGAPQFLGQRLLVFVRRGVRNSSVKALTQILSGPINSEQVTHDFCRTRLAVETL
jgi:hypothetical protein